MQKPSLKQVTLLELNLNDLSLQAKKLDVSTDMWQARVNRSWRFYFTIEKIPTSFTNFHKLIPRPK